MVAADGRVSLDQVGTVARGRSRHRPRDDSILYGGKYPFVQTGDVKRATLYLNDYSQTYNEVGLAQSKLWPVGTLCITIAANIAETAILGIPACFPDSVIGFTPDPKKSDLRFVKYCLDCFKLQVQAISQGTTQDNLSLEKLKSLRFLMPPVEEQKKIAAILTAYDDLIENNRQRIALLEKMAEEIYREWFVRLRFPGHEHTPVHKGVPEGWAPVRLGDMYQTAAGGTPSRSESRYFGGKIPWVKTGELKQAFIFDTEERITEDAINNSSAKLLPSGTVVMAMYCAMEDVTILGTEAATNQACCALLPREPHVGPEFTYQQIRLAIREMTNWSHGAAQQNLSQTLIRAFPVFKPEKGVVEQYCEIARPMFELIKQLMTSTAKLSETRDLLLNRLISGKLRVDDLDIQFPPSMQDKAA